MQPKSPKLLVDISDAVSFILESTRNKTLEDYRQDRQMRQAVERNFEIIGEAVNRLTRIDPAIASRISSTAQIIAFRNVLIHGYDLINDKEVWQVITNSLSKLQAEILSLLSAET
ncbi:MAG TPA: HepT-like ribonuclease domain-containing protein [Phycisphaerae bacterium]|nr:HepT-like ribonuclease domain-containing protein [Phycisphaerae bacterium]